jgi:hypothetical protein
VSDIIPHRHARTRHLSVVRTESAPTSAPTVAEPTRQPLSRPAALRLDQAELFLLSLDSEMLTADSLRAAYLLGIAELHLAGLIEIVRAVAS